MSINLEQVNKYYNYKKSNQNHALRDINLKINDGEFDYSFYNCNIY